VLAGSLVRRTTAEDLRLRELLRCAALGRTRRVPSLPYAPLRGAVVAVGGRIKFAMREAARPPSVVTGIAVEQTRSHKKLLAENAFLRQQPIGATRPLRGLRALRADAECDRVAKGAGIRVIRPAAKAPLLNATRERYVGKANRRLSRPTVRNEKTSPRD